MRGQTRSSRVVLVVLCTGLALLAAAAGVVFVLSGNDARGEYSWPPPPPTLHGDLSVAPVPGWRTKLTDMVSATSPLRPHTLSIPSPLEAVPYLGNLGATGFFIAEEPRLRDKQWWLIAVNVDDGRPAFPPVLLSTTSEPPRCFLNVDSVLCLDDKGSPATAKVVDVRSGRTSFEGPTDLRADGADLSVRQIGTFSVATTQGRGVFGIGALASTTWFVPGEGDVPLAAPSDQSDTPSKLTTQSASDPRNSVKTVFSVQDGHVVSPQIEAGSRIERAVTYPGGFAAEVATADGPTQVRLFDEAGRRLSDHGQPGRLSTASLDYPIVEVDDGKWLVFAPDGIRIFEGDGKTPDGVRVVGDWLFANLTTNSGFPEWQQYSWRTGAKGKVCEFDMMRRYRGSDGEVGVFAVENPQAGVSAKGRRLSTCDELWSLPARPGSLTQVWRIGTVLVQLSDDGTELDSLVAARRTSDPGQ